MADLAERVQRVRLLLITMNDPWPTPYGALATESGPAASRYVPCETCQERGRVKQRGGWILCLVCDGHGWRRREHGMEEWDAYLRMPVEEAVQLPVEAPPRNGTRAATTAPESDAYGWEQVLARYRRYGSYDAVQRELGWLEGVRPRRHWLVRTVLVEHEPIRLRDRDRADLDLGVVAITLRLPRVRVPHWLVERDEAVRKNESIAALAAEGYSAGEIARRTGIEKKVVRRRLKAIHSKGAGIPLGAM